MGQQQLKLMNLRKKLISVRNKINIQINEGIDYLTEMESLVDETRPVCRRCGWRNLRVRKDKSYFCQSCGFDSKEDMLK